MKFIGYLSALSIVTYLTLTSAYPCSDIFFSDESILKLESYRLKSDELSALIYVNNVLALSRDAHQAVDQLKNMVSELKAIRDKRDKMESIFLRPETVNRFFSNKEVRIMAQKMIDERISEVNSLLERIEGKTSDLIKFSSERKEILLHARQKEFEIIHGFCVKNIEEINKENPFLNEYYNQSQVTTAESDLREIAETSTILHPMSEKKMAKKKPDLIQDKTQSIAFLLKNHVQIEDFFRLCQRGEVNYSYLRRILQGLTQSDRQLVLSLDFSGKVAGFVISRYLPEPDVKLQDAHIELICAEPRQGLGSLLINSVENPSKPELQPDRIVVDALKNVVPFYEKLGFNVRDKSKDSSETSHLIKYTIKDSDQKDKLSIYLNRAISHSNLPEVKYLEERIKN